MGTGKALVKKIITVSDLGRVLNKRAVEGQQEGGVVMGVGYALTENYKSEKGNNTTETFGELGLTTANEAPAKPRPNPTRRRALYVMSSPIKKAVRRAIITIVWDIMAVILAPSLSTPNPSKILSMAPDKIGSESRVAFSLALMICPVSARASVISVLSGPSIVQTIKLISK